MPNATEILIIIARRHPSAVCVDELAPFAPKTKERQLVLQSIGTLLNNKLVERHEKLKTPVHYIVTKKGLEMYRAGKPVTSGPNGPHTGVRKAQPDTLRARLWRALRIAKKASIPALLQIALDVGKDGEKAQHNARRYFKDLVRAGVIAELPAREKTGFRGSNGFKRFALLKDLGPEAPIPKVDCVYDPNAKHGEMGRPDRLPYHDSAKPSKSEAA